MPAPRALATLPAAALRDRQIETYGFWARKFLSIVRTDGAECALMLAWGADDPELNALLVLPHADLEALAGYEPPARSAAQCAIERIRINKPPAAKRGTTAKGK